MLRRMSGNARNRIASLGNLTRSVKRETVTENGFAHKRPLPQNQERRRPQISGLIREMIGFAAEKLVAFEVGAKNAFLLRYGNGYREGNWETLSRPGAAYQAPPPGLCAAGTAIDGLFVQIAWA